MKHFLVLFFSLSTSLISYADMGTDLQKNCETPEALAAKGVGGSCRVVVAPKRVEKRGMCEGIFSGKLKCEVQFSSTEHGSSLNLLCGDKKSPVVNQDFSADVMSINNLVIIKNAAGKETIINDPTEFTLISSKMIEIILSEDTNQKVVGSINILLDKGNIPLTDVSCY